LLISSRKRDTENRGYIHTQGATSDIARQIREWKKYFSGDIGIDE